MITFNDIGANANRFANQITQYIALFSLAKKNGYDFAIPYKNENSPPETSSLMDMGTGKWIYTPLKVHKCFDITSKNLTDEDFKSIDNEFVENDDGGIGFDKRFFNISDNTNLKGYYQSEKYWEHCEDLVREELTFKNEIYNEAIKQINEIKNGYEGLISIHFRLTDLAANPNYPTLPNDHPDYYQLAINKFKDYTNHRFVIFSDDIELCKKMISNKDETFFVENNSDYVDLCMLSLCDHNIIANSTFSWWGAWLNRNPNKKVIAPSKWLAGNIEHLHSKDLYCKNWEVI